MKGRIFKFLIATVSTVLIIVLSIYLFAAISYRKGFGFDTWINGSFCTGKTVEAVDAELLRKETQTTITVSSKLCGEENILLSDIGYTISYKEPLLEIIDKQKSFRWYEDLFSGRNTYEISPVILFDSSKLKDCISDLMVVDECSKEHAQSASIEYDEIKGYVLKEDIPLNIEVDSLYDILSESIVNGNFSVEIPDELFSERTPEPFIKSLRRVYEDYLEFSKVKLSYDMGDETIPFDGSILSRFISFDYSANDFVRDENGNIAVSKEAVDKYADELFDMYDTYLPTRKYVTYAGEEKTVSHVYYGTLINRVKEKQYMYDSIVSGLSEVHIPEYSVKGYVRGKNDIGKDFVEIDLTNQVLYVIREDALIYTADVVTGKPSAGDATPDMVCSIHKKQKGAVLRGDDYESYVSYWMPIYKGIGIHDANWQRAFGGDRYIRYGSHGCINVSPKDAVEIFDLIEVGMPVIVYK